MEILSVLIYICCYCEEEIFPHDRDKNCLNCNSQPPHSPIAHVDFSN